MDEIWKDIEGFEGHQVSNEGQVRRFGKTDRLGRKWEDKILSPFTNKHGYKIISLRKDGVKKYFQIHRLVYETFCGKIPSGMQVNHINENKSDNRLCNLNLMTPKENVNWGTRNDRIAKAAKNNPNRSKPVVGYDAEGNVVVEFPSAHEADRNGYNQGCVSSCCRGEKHYYRGLTWKYLSSD